MARSERPLLADDGSSTDERLNQEEDTLLTGERKPTESKYGWPFWREIGAFVWAFGATIAVIILAVLYSHSTTTPSTNPSDPDRSKDHGHDPAKIDGKRNLIFMVSDGMGPASLSLTRSFRQFTTGLPIDDLLVLDQHLIGQSRTRSSSSLVTDSAAGATAFSCGKKSYNGAISILPDHTPCGTVLEAAKKAGYTTGLVVTTRITDATPATFAAHVNMRSEEDSISRQMIGEHPLGHVVDLMFGGGRCHFLPNSTDGSCRADSYDVIKSAKSKGYNYISTRKEFDALNAGKSVSLPLLGLFAPTDIPYEIDRRTQNDTYPSLDEMARTALTALTAATKDSDKGFFLMIEGSRIDHAGHGNDPQAQVHEVLAYDQAFSSVLDFLDKDSTPGVLVGTSDHETGGLSLARQLHTSYPEYLWYPGVLANASHSGEYLAASLQSFVRNGIKSNEEIEAYIRKLVKDELGIKDASDAEISDLMTVKDDGLRSAYGFSDLVSRRAQTGWSTHGHSAVDVNIYSSSPKHAKALVGNHENTEVGEFLASFLDLDVHEITKELNEDKVKDFGYEVNGQKQSWVGQPVEKEDHELNSYDHYEGDFKKRGLSDCGCGMH